MRRARRLQRYAVAALAGATTAALLGLLALHLWPPHQHGPPEIVACRPGFHYDADPPDGLGPACVGPTLVLCVDLGSGDLIPCPDRPEPHVAPYGHVEPYSEPDAPNSGPAAS